VNTFLPELMNTIIFVRFFIKRQVRQNLPDIVFGKILYQSLRRPLFVSRNISIQCPTMQNKMAVIFQHDRRINL